MSSRRVPRARGAASSKPASLYQHLTVTSVKFDQLNPLVRGEQDGLFSGQELRKTKPEIVST